MDRKIFRNNEKGKKIVLKRHGFGNVQGKNSIGFTSFKLVNSNIKLVKQVEVKTSVIRAKSSGDAPQVPKTASETLVRRTNENILKNEEKHPKISTADTLKAIREKMQAKKKLNSAHHLNTSALDIIPNGVHTSVNKQANENLREDTQSDHDTSCKEKTKHDGKKLIESKAHHKNTGDDKIRHEDRKNTNKLSFDDDEMCCNDTSQQSTGTLEVDVQNSLDSYKTPKKCSISEDNIKSTSGNEFHSKRESLSINKVKNSKNKIKRRQLKSRDKDDEDHLSQDVLSTSKSRHSRKSRYEKEGQSYDRKHSKSRISADEDHSSPDVLSSSKSKNSRKNRGDRLDHSYEKKRTQSSEDESPEALSSSKSKSSRKIRGEKRDHSFERKHSKSYVSDDEDCLPLKVLSSSKAKISVKSRYEKQDRSHEKKHIQSSVSDIDENSSPDVLSSSKSKSSGKGSRKKRDNSFERKYLKSYASEEEDNHSSDALPLLKSRNSGKNNREKRDNYKKKHSKSRVSDDEDYLSQDIHFSSKSNNSRKGHSENQDLSYNRKYSKSHVSDNEDHRSSDIVSSSQSRNSQKGHREKQDDSYERKNSKLLVSVDKDHSSPDDFSSSKSRNSGKGLREKHDKTHERKCPKSHVSEDEDHLSQDVINLSKSRSFGKSHSEKRDYRYERKHLKSPISDDEDLSFPDIASSSRSKGSGKRHSVQQDNRNEKYFISRVNDDEDHFSEDAISLSKSTKSRKSRKEKQDYDYEGRHSESCVSDDGDHSSPVLTSSKSRNSRKGQGENQHRSYDREFSKSCVDDNEDHRSPDVFSLSKSRSSGKGRKEKLYRNCERRISSSRVSDDEYDLSPDVISVSKSKNSGKNRSEKQDRSYERKHSKSHISDSEDLMLSEAPSSSKSGKRRSEKQNYGYERKHSKPNHHASGDSDNKVKYLVNTQERASPQKVDSKHNSHEKADKRHHDKDEYRSKRGHKSDQAFQKQPESRRPRDRSKSRSPHREHRYYEKEKYPSSKRNDRARSPYSDHGKEEYQLDRNHFYNKEHSDNKSHSRSKHKEKLYARKYSLSADNRNTSRDDYSRDSHSKSSSRRGDTKIGYKEEEDHRHSRSLNHHQSSHDRDVSSRKHSQDYSIERSDDLRKKDRDKSTRSPRLSTKMEKMPSKRDDKEMKRNTKVDEGLFTKLSMAFSLDGEDEDFEVEIPRSDDDSDKRNCSKETSRTNASVETSFESDTVINMEFLPREQRSPSGGRNDALEVGEIPNKHSDTAGEESSDNIQPPMLVVDEVKNDSSEYEMNENRKRWNYDELTGSSQDEFVDDNYMYVTNADSSQFSNDRLVSSYSSLNSSKANSKNILSLNIDTSMINRQLINNNPDVDSNCDVNIPSPPTPLMDEPQDPISFISPIQNKGNPSSCESPPRNVPIIPIACSETTIRHIPVLTTSVHNNISVPIVKDEFSVMPVGTCLRDIPASGVPQVDSNTVMGKESDENLSQSNLDNASLVNPVMVEEDFPPSTDEVDNFSSDNQVNINSEPHCEAVSTVSSANLREPLSSGSDKIPQITSRLQTVYQSLLQTNFKEDDLDKNLHINGVITESVTLDSENIEVNAPEKPSDNCPDISSLSSDASKISYGAEIVDQKPCDITENRKTDSPSVTDSDSALFQNSDVTVKMSPHRLTLHATTKTPLPAKKSYIKQVQNDSVGAQGTLMLEHHPVKTEDEKVTDVTGLDEPEPNSDVDCKPAHCEPNQGIAPKTADILVDDLGLSRQDSSGSSANDNEEGPRRSARIRTKKSERILKKQASCENIPCQNLSSTVSTTSTEPVQLPASTANTQVPPPEISLKDLSEEDAFKAKIHLMPGIPDCPDRFHILDENLYLTSVKKSRARKEIKRMVCDCGLEDTSDSDEPCGENCLNRLLMIECSSRCHNGNKCTNKRFQMRKYAPTEVFKTDFKGWGIRAAEFIKPGELVMEYCGEVVDQREFTRRSLEYSKSNHAHFYFMALSQDEVIDATYKGNASRFINHSCDPNAETQKWTVNGRLRVGFFTVKPIKKGEEITFDYQFERYGKIAQKCYCGAAKCRGYLGKAPDENDEDNTKFSRLLSSEALENDSTDSLEKSQKKKKLSLFEDNMMEKDISKFRGGLHSTKEVLSLSRLMVRCDTHVQRSLCLQVLKDTNCQTWLKSFLQFHGLSIIWSWMVDITGAQNDDANLLKMDIINTLCILPINNKNVIEDSKVLSVVQRWATPEEEEKEKPATVEEIVKTETPSGKDEMDVKDDNVKKEPSTELQDPVKVEAFSVEAKAPDEVAAPQSPEAKDTVTEDASEDKPKNEVSISSEAILEAAAKLLDSWKDLKEIYRIPKRRKPTPSPPHSRTSSPVLKQSRSDEVEVKPHRFSTSNSWRDGSLERWKDVHERSFREKHENQFSPGSSTSSENRKEPGRRKRRFSTDSDDGSVPWHCKPPRSSKISREEHRRKFEQDMEKREQEKKRLEEQMEVEMAQNTTINSQPQFMVDEIPPLMGQDMVMMSQGMPAGTTFTPSGVSGNLIQINPAPPAQIMVDQFGQPIMQQSAFPLQQGFNVMPGMYSTDLGLPQGYQNAYGMQVATMQDTMQMNSFSQQAIMGTAVNMGVPHPPIPVDMGQAQQPPMPTMQPTQPQAPINDVTILGTQNGQAIVMLSAEQLQKLTQAGLPASSNTEATKDSKKVEVKKEKSSSKKKSIPEQLPPNWKTATDKEGRVYYYHDITRETQWDPPKWNEDNDNKKNEGFTPTHDDRQSKGKGDGITDEGRKAKDQFRLKMSQFVIHCLGSYRKPDRKIGRITSTEDFKHLARKLTHIIMQKELKQVQVWEDLDFNANVKHKTKEYVKKYMSKVGPVYRIKDDT